MTTTRAVFLGEIEALAERGHSPTVAPEHLAAHLAEVSIEHVRELESERDALRRAFLAEQAEHRETRRQLAQMTEALDAALVREEALKTQCEFKQAFLERREEHERRRTPWRMADSWDERRDGVERRKA